MPVITRSKASTNNIDLIVAHNVRIQRIAKRRTQQQLAAYLGLTFQQIQKYEKGTNRIGSGRLLQIAAFFEVHPMVLFSGADLGGSGSKSNILSLLSEPHSLRLVQAFSKITDKKLRKTVLDLVEDITTIKRN